MSAGETRVVATALGLTMLGVVCVRIAFFHRSRKQNKKIVTLIELREKGTIPDRLLPSFYFDQAAHSFRHDALLKNSNDVVDILDGIHNYVMVWIQQQLNFIKRDPSRKKTLTSATPSPPTPDSPTATERIALVVSGSLHTYLPADPGTHEFRPERLQGPPTEVSLHNMHSVIVGKGAKVLGGYFDVTKGAIYLGAGTVMEPGVSIKGPTVIGDRCVLRAGAYLRGDVIIGDDCVVRCEVKNSVIMDKTELCHPGYVGDSILGYKSHFGCQALTANLGLLGGEEEETTICIDVDGVRIDLNRRKMGAVVGDWSQLGCNSVTEPGALIGPRTHVYPLTRLPKGLYGPDEIIKNKPWEHGIVECSPLR
uniref:Uncharacterized protein n=1 Tax=Octactis speculum TaxID=3111310 RepID=A0A7S2GJ39_9STRA|mmetsp:Transcript_48288/g.65726  ORF Transcript_48288/g.65726 Transcript_48288/m.65726 type:complete len:366 (+) Transcript_48288:168-1265(+)